MTAFSAAVTITRPVGDVFAVVSNPVNDAKWSPAVVIAEQTTLGPIGVGTRARFVSQLMGRQVENEWLITEFDAGRRFVATTVAGPLPTDITVDTIPITGGTRIVMTYALRPRGFYRLVTPLGVMYGRRYLQGALQRLKEMMEIGEL